MASIGDIIKAGITEGKSTGEILKDVYASHPQANTKAASVSWYRAQMKKAGTATEAPKKKATSKAVSEAVAPTKRETFEDFKRAAGLKVGPMYEVRGVKSTQGMEGAGYIASLYCDGKKIAEAHDYGDGGCVFWYWADAEAPKVDVTFTNYMLEKYTRKATPLEKQFIDFTQALPYEVNPYDDEKVPRPVDIDGYVEELVNDFQLKKQLKSLCKGRIAFLLEVEDKGKKKTNIYTVKAEPTPENIQKHVLAKNPQALILNTMDEAAALAALRKLQY